MCIRDRSYLSRADAAATVLRAGMYRHRPRYMLADALAWLGRLGDSEQLFREASELSRDVEPHTMGMARAMIGLALLRQGRIEAAIKELEAPDAIPTVLESKVALAIAIGLGILAEARLEYGDRTAR